MATRRRRNGLALKQNSAKDRFIARSHGLALSTVKRMKSKSGDPSRYAELFREAGGATGLKKYKAKGKATRASVKSGSYKYSTWGAKKKKAAPKRRRAAAKRKTRKKSTRKGGVSAWNRYVAEHRGMGMSMSEIADKARKEGVIGGRSNPRRRKNALALKTNRRRRNALALKTNRRRKLSAWNRFVKKHAGSGHSMSKLADMARKQGVLKNNPKRRRNSYRKRTRKNAGSKPMFGALALRTNRGMDSGIGPIDAVAGAVDKIPVIGKPIAPYIAPLAVGAASGAGVFYLTSLIDDRLPEWAQPYSYSMAGVLGAVATLMVPVGSTDARRMVAAGMATVGAGIDVFRHFFMREEGAAMAQAGLLEGEILAEDEGLGAWKYSANPYGAWEYTGGALNNPGYGAWEYTGGALNNPSYGGYGYGDDEEGAEEYTDANGADVEASGNDFDAEEGQAIVAGPRVWWRRFGRPGKRMYHRQQQGTYSRHAGRKGHRWGWLIKLVGFKGARHIASMPPQRRVQVIQQLKQQARATLRQHLSSSQNIVPDQPHVYEESGVTGAHGYGALMYAGQSY